MNLVFLTLHLSADRPPEILNITYVYKLLTVTKSCETEPRKNDELAPRIVEHSIVRML
jgi:hypothetical protein